MLADPSKITWNDADRDGKIEEKNFGIFSNTSDGDRVVIRDESK